MPTRKGDPAPFDGQFLTTDLAVRLAQGSANCQTRIDEEVKREKADAAIDVQREKDLHAKDVEDLTATMQDLEKKLDEADKVADEDKPPFYAQPWFVGPVASILTAGVVVWALHH
jgi:hypothetical protein